MKEQKENRSKISSFENTQDTTRSLIRYRDALRQLMEDVYVKITASALK
jgi:hypothetical protein